MQYKIPVQIENEDPIIFNLSLRQIIIIMVGFAIAYSLFNALAKSFPAELALLPSAVIFILSVVIAVFKYAEMSFLPFVLSFVRYKINISERKWQKGVDSFSVLDIGYIKYEQKQDEKVDFGDKMDKMKSIDEKLEKI